MKRQVKSRKRPKTRRIIEFREQVDPHNGTAWDNLYDPEDDEDDPLHQSWHDHPVRDLFDNLRELAEQLETELGLD